MAVSPLERKNIERCISEFQKDEAVLGKYRDRGFFSLDEALTYLSEQITGLETELEEEADD